MKTHRLRFPLLVCLLALTLTTPAWGASPNGESGRLTDPLARLWNALTAFWAEEGCWIDPHGGCTTNSPQAPSADAGCWLDPHGGCATGLSESPATQPKPDEGCWLDPNGGCAAGS